MYLEDCETTKEQDVTVDLFLETLNTINDLYDSLKVMKNSLGLDGELLLSNLNEDIKGMIFIERDSYEKVLIERNMALCKENENLRSKLKVTKTNEVSLDYEKAYNENIEKVKGVSL